MVYDLFAHALIDLVLFIYIEYVLLQGCLLRLLTLNALQASNVREMSSQKEWIVKIRILLRN